MPLYTYHCRHCLCEETRVAGIDDHALMCLHCGRDMKRREGFDSLFGAYE